MNQRYYLLINYLLINKEFVINIFIKLLIFFNI